MKKTLTVIFSIGIISHFRFFNTCWIFHLECRGGAPSPAGSLLTEPHQLHMRTDQTERTTTPTTLYKARMGFIATRTI